MSAVRGRSSSPLSVVYHIKIRTPVTYSFVQAVVSRLAYFDKSDAGGMAMLRCRPGYCPGSDIVGIRIPDCIAHVAEVGVHDGVPGNVDHANAEVILPSIFAPSAKPPAPQNRRP